MFGLFFQVKIGENLTKKVLDSVSFLLKSRRFVIYDFHLFGKAFLTNIADKDFVGACVAMKTKILS